MNCSYREGIGDVGSEASRRNEEGHIQSLVLALQVFVHVVVGGAKSVDIGPVYRRTRQANLGPGAGGDDLEVRGPADRLSVLKI